MVHKLKIIKILFVFTALFAVLASIPSNALVYDPYSELGTEYYNHLSGVSIKRSYYDWSESDADYPAYFWDVNPSVFGMVDQTFRMNATYDGSSSFQQVCALRNWREISDINPFSCDYIIGGFNDTLAKSYNNTLEISGTNIIVDSASQLWTDGIQVDINGLQYVADNCSYNVYATFTYIDTFSDVGQIKTLTYSFESPIISANESGRIYFKLLPSVSELDPLYQLDSSSLISLNFTSHIDIYTDYSGQKFSVVLPCKFSDSPLSSLNDLIDFLDRYGYDLGYDNGYDLGFDEGFDEGFNEGSANGFDFVSFLKVTLGSFFEIQIMPNVTIGLIASVIFTVILLMVFLHKFGGR